MRFRASSSMQDQGARLCSQLQVHHLCLHTPLQSSSSLSHHCHYIPCRKEENSSYVLNKYHSLYVSVEAISPRTYNNGRCPPVPTGCASDALCSPTQPCPGTAARTARTRGSALHLNLQETHSSQLQAKPHARAAMPPCHGSPGQGQACLYSFFHSLNAQISYFFPTKTRRTKDRNQGTA